MRPGKYYTRHQRLRTKLPVRPPARINYSSVVERSCSNLRALLPTRARKVLSTAAFEFSSRRCRFHVFVSGRESLESCGCLTRRASQQVRNATNLGIVRMEIGMARLGSFEISNLSRHVPKSRGPIAHSVFAIGSPSWHSEQRVRIASSGGHEASNESVDGWLAWETKSPRPKDWILTRTGPQFVCDPTIQQDVCARVHLWRASLERRHRLRNDACRNASVRECYASAQAKQHHRAILEPQLFRSTGPRKLPRSTPVRCSCQFSTTRD